MFNGSCLTVALAALTLASACGGEPIEVVDPATIPATVTYSQHIAPMMSFYCEACHAPDAQIGVSEDLDYSSYEQVKSGRGWEGIVETVFGDSSMPPGAARRISPREQAILRRWRDQGFAR